MHMYVFQVFMLSVAVLPVGASRNRGRFVRGTEG